MVTLAQVQIKRTKYKLVHDHAIKKYVVSADSNSESSYLFMSDKMEPAQTFYDNLVELKSGKV
jgi:hypothetical protein